MGGERSCDNSQRFQYSTAAASLRSEFVHTDHEFEKAALEAEGAAKWLDGKTIRKIIVVPGKIVNIVIG